PELAHQLEAMPRDLAVVKRSVEQLTEKQEQMARNIATLRSAEHDIKKKTSSPHVQSRVKLTPWPETRPTTIAGWTLHGVTNGTAVLEGPSGIWRAMQGDTVPGGGRGESMVRWGDRLIVATTSGLISTPQAASAAAHTLLLPDAGNFCIARVGARPEEDKRARTLL